jgi:hypothetical protein
MYSSTGRRSSSLSTGGRGSGSGGGVLAALCGARERTFVALLLVIGAVALVSLGTMSRHVASNMRAPKTVQEIASAHLQCVFSRV